MSESVIFHETVSSHCCSQTRKLDEEISSFQLSIGYQESNFHLSSCVETGTKALRSCSLMKKELNFMNSLRLKL